MIQEENIFFRKMLIVADLVSLRVVPILKRDTTGQSHCSFHLSPFDAPYIF